MIKRKEYFDVFGDAETHPRCKEFAEDAKERISQMTEAYRCNKCNEHTPNLNYDYEVTIGNIIIRCKFENSDEKHISLCDGCLKDLIW